MFGLRNQRGSCWINAALQGIFRIPDLQQRFQNNQEDENNPVETCLAEIWNSRGEEGLKDFYSCVKTSTMPAGEGIGDSHELIEFVCDKVPFLNQLTKFKVVHSVRCNHCATIVNKQEELNEFSVAAARKNERLMDLIIQSVTPINIPDWKCDKCKQHGCNKQLLLVEFPQVMIFHVTSIGNPISYTPMLSLNGIQYALCSIVCYTGGHWMTWGRNLPPGQPWYSLDDSHIQKYDATRMPLAEHTVRLLMYYRLEQ